MFQTLVQYDISLLNTIRSFIDPNSHVQVLFVKLFSDSEVIIVALMLLGMWLYGVYKKDTTLKIDALKILWIIGGIFLIYALLNNLMPYRPRPETVSAIKPLISHLPDNSFPSGHGLFAGASIFAAFMILRRKWIGWTLLVFSILMLFARVAAGIHYPGDVVGGFILGLIAAPLIYSFEKKEWFKKYFLDLPLKIASFIKL